MKNNLELHKPVLLEEVLGFIKGQPFENPSYLDATFGRGGHALEVDKLFNDLKIVAVDQDPEAIAYGQELFKEKLLEEKILFIHSNFSEIKQKSNQINQFLKKDSVSYILADLGVSSPQLDDARRGFSFYKKGPLDMRMNDQEGITAKDIVNHWSEQELSDLFFNKGEVRRPQKVVAKIIERRKIKNFETTDDLAVEIEKCLGWRKKGQHPATQFFLALRLEVNQELEVVENTIEDFLDLLQPGGRLLVITFHSLEDRIVKYKFKELAQTKGKILTKKVIQATWQQKKANKRARSAKLRVFERGAMSDRSISELKPFLSVIIVILTLFSLVFLKMEGRRLGYYMLKQVQEYKTMQDLHRLKVIEYAQLTSPERLRALAKTKLTLGEAELGQIIQISGEKVALKQ